MKTMLVLLAGLLPLGVLTARTTAQLLSHAEPSLRGEGPVAGEFNQEQGLQVVAEVVREVSDDRAIVSQLSEVDLFQEAELPKLSAKGADEQFKAIEASWNSLRKAREAWVGLSRVYRKKLADQGEHDALTLFLSAKPLDGVAGNDALRNLLEERIVVLEDLEQARKQLAEARQFFENRAWSDCLKRLELIKVAVLATADQKECEQLKQRARFKQHWTGLSLENASPQQVRDELQKRLQDTPPAVDSVDGEFLKRRSAELAHAENAIRIDELFKHPQPTLKELLENCDRLLGDAPEAAAEIRKGFRDWTHRQLPQRKALKIPAELEETWTKSGNYLRGVFRVDSPADEPNVRYRYWKDVLDFRADKAFSQIYLSNLDSSPQKLLEVRSMAEYEKQRKELLAGISSRPAWEQFAEACGRIQQDVDQYYDRRGGETERKVVFKAARRFALSMVENWKIAGRLLK